MKKLKQFCVPVSILFIIGFISCLIMIDAEKERAIQNEKSLRISVDSIKMNQTTKKVVCDSISPVVLKIKKKNVRKFRAKKKTVVSKKLSEHQQDSLNRAQMPWLYNN